MCISRASCNSQPTKEMKIDQKFNSTVTHYFFLYKALRYHLIYRKVEEKQTRKNAEKSPERRG